MLTLARIVGVAVGLFIGVAVDEQLMKGTPEGTAATIPTAIAVLGWVVATFRVRRRARLST